MFNSKKFFLSSLVVLGAAFPLSAYAVTLDAAVTSRPGFSTGDVDFNSYDGPGFDAFMPFQSFTSPQLSQVNAFTGAPGGSKLEFFLLSEVAYYDGSVPGLGDSFGLLSSQGSFIPVISAEKTPGASAEYIQGADEELRFALDSPEGLFSSVDSDNPDKVAHMIAMTVDSPGAIDIIRANLHGLSLTFNLQFGDIVLFIEDLMTSGNMLQGGLASDFDYNDAVVVVRSSAIPEPATVLLLGAGLLGAASRRRRNGRLLA